MILDKDGNPIKTESDQHRFGQFKIPDNCHIKGFGTIRYEQPPATDQTWYKLHTAIRCEDRK